MLLIDVRAADAEADERLARGHQVGIALTVSGARPRRNLVVACRGRPLGVLRADGKDERIVRRVVEPSGPETCVSARDDDDDALAPGRLHRVRKRIDPVVLHTVGSEREVEDTDVEAVGITMLDDPVDPGDDLRDVCRSRPVCDLDRNDAGIGGETGKARAMAHLGAAVPGNVISAGDDAGQVRTVTVAVQVATLILLRIERQIRSVDELARSAQAFNRRHARVDHRDVDVAAGIAMLPERTGARQPNKVLG